jgi:hypothetical protein
MEVDHKTHGKPHTQARTGLLVLLVLLLVPRLLRLSRGSCRGLGEVALKEREGDWGGGGRVRVIPTAAWWEGMEWRWCG